jgi:hypothetical protein
MRGGVLWVVHKKVFGVEIDWKYQYHIISLS